VDTLDSANQLLEQIAQAFRKVRYPGDGQITCHPCDECDQLQRDFSGQVPRTMSQSLVGSHFGDLSLLTDAAKQFFLPAFLRTSILAPESTVTEFILYSLDSDHRWDPPNGYTEPQKNAILAYLDHVEPRIDTALQKDLQNARTRWQRTV
jgi:hypothetical protein